MDLQPALHKKCLFLPPTDCVGRQRQDWELEGWAWGVGAGGGGGGRLPSTPGLSPPPPPPPLHPPFPPLSPSACTGMAWEREEGRVGENRTRERTPTPLPPNPTPTLPPPQREGTQRRNTIQTQLNAVSAAIYLQWMINWSLHSHGRISKIAIMGRIVTLNMHRPRI